MYAEIKAIGGYLPDLRITNGQLGGIVETSHEWIHSRTGIAERRIATDENTSDLCAAAAQEILRDAELSPSDVDLIIIATITADYLTPSTACIVQKKIGAHNAFAFDLNAGCSGFVYALSVADKYIRSGLYKNILVLGGEVISKITDWRDRRTCVLFGDGAGGVLLGAGSEPHFLAEDMHADGERYTAITAGYSPVDHYFAPYDRMSHDPYISMDGRRILDFAVRSVPASIMTVVEKAGLTLADVSAIIPHQVNYRIVQGIAKKLKVEPDKFYTNMDRYGNTSAASIPIALWEMHEKGLLRKSDIIIMTGFGAGLTWGSMLIQY